MTAKYIKLGKQGEWEQLCFDHGTLRLGYYEIPHDLALAGNKDAIRDFYIAQGFSRTAATNHARQVLDFYHAGPDTIWITFSKGSLWWCRATGGVEFLGHDKGQNPKGSRLRRTGGWSNRSETGQELRMNDLSGRLTRSAAYRQTICDITGDALEYLMRKIKGQDMPAVAEAREARDTLLDKTKALIGLLTWQDFELFVDILFTKSGWVRVSDTGKTMKDIDIELFLPVTGEKALVQIKSKTTQAELDEYAQNLKEHGSDQIFYVYHAPPALLDGGHESVRLMNIDALAQAALRTGLVDWLIEKS